MAQAKEQKPATGPILAILSSIFMPLIFSVFLFIIIASDSRANGTSAMEPINPSPNSQESIALQQLAVFTDPNAVITASTAQLSTIAAELQTLSSSSMVAPAQQVVIKAAQQDIQCIIVSAATDKTKANNCAKDFVKHLTELETSFFSGNGDIVAAAKQIVEYNNPGGHITSNVGKILYIENSDFSWSNNYPDRLDCSAFVSFVMARAGYWELGHNFFDRLNTTALFTDSGIPTDKHHLSRIIFTGDVIPKTEILAKAADGTIKPGDIFLSGNVDGAGMHTGKSGHTFLYLGGDPDGDSIASSKGSHKNQGGPQYSSLKRIEDDVIGVLRVTGSPNKPSKP